MTDKMFLDLFCGGGSVGKTAQERGYKVISVDKDAKLEPTHIIDLSVWYPAKLITDASFVWMSPPCATLSMASGNTHWTKDRQPKTDDAWELLAIVSNIKEIIHHCETLNIPYVVENPRARMRWFLGTGDNHREVWYCKYGYDRAKPTDVWTNIKGFVGVKCANKGTPVGDACHHVAAPRGSQTGTQGRSLFEKWSVPPQLVLSLIETWEGGA